MTGSGSIFTSLNARPFDICGKGRVNKLLMARIRDIGVLTVILEQLYPRDLYLRFGGERLVGEKEKMR